MNEMVQKMEKDLDLISINSVEFSQCRLCWDDDFTVENPLL